MLGKKVPPKLWRYLTDFWTIVAFAVIIEDFRTHGGLESLIRPVTSIYIAVLAIFSAEKEFERWQLYNAGRHRGELYVVVWTALIIFMMAMSYIFPDRGYKMNEIVYSTYIVVLGVLAITRKSKEIFAEKLEKSIEE